MGYCYILKCADDSYYTGSTKDLHRRLKQHQSGKGANHTKNRLPVKLVYWEEYDRIDHAFYREKQIQGWSRAKKEALMRGDLPMLHTLAECRNSSHCRFDSAQRPGSSSFESTEDGDAHGAGFFSSDLKDEE